MEQVTTSDAHRASASAGRPIACAALLALLIAGGAARTQAQIPGQLQGSWVRDDSNYDPNDRMRVRIEGDRATLTHVPATGHRAFRVGQTLWLRLAADGSLAVLGSDGAHHPATLRLQSADVILLQISTAGAGDVQTWRRAGPSVDGEWVRVAPPGDPEDGTRIRADGDRASIRYLPGTAPRAYRVGSAVWRDLAAGGTVAVLGSDGQWLPARITLEGEDRLLVSGAALKTPQLWVRPEAAEAVRVALEPPPAAREQGGGLTAPELPGVTVP